MALLFHGSSFLEAVTQSARGSVELAQRLIQLRAKYHQIAQDRKWPAACLPLIDALFERPLLTIKRVEELAQVTTPTASAHLKRLEEAGIVSEHTGRQRNRRYLALELLRVVHAPTGQRATPDAARETPEDRRPS